MSILEERTAIAVKKHVGTKLRAAGIADVERFAPHTLPWSDLNKRQRSVQDIARAMIDAANDNQLEDRSFMEAHDGIMELWDAIDREKNIRTEIGSREARDNPHSPMVPRGEDMEVRADGTHARSLRPGRDDEETVAHALRPEQRMADWARENVANREDPGVSAGAFLRAMVIGPKNDAERRALSEGTDSAGGYTVPDILSAQLIDRLRAQSVLVQAGARTVPLTSDQNYIAKIATDPVPAWRAENAAIAESDPTFARVEMAPKSLAVLVKVSREVLEDSLNIEEALTRSLTAALALEFDRAGMFGLGTGSEPQGLVNMTGVGAVALSGALATYAPLIAARTAVLTANAGEPTAFIMNPREDGVLTGLVDTTGQPLQAPAKIAAIRQLVTTSVPVDDGVGTNEATIIAGNFARFMIGVRNGMRIEVLKERYADNHQYGFVAHMRGTFAVEHAGAFHKTTAITPAA